MACLAPATSITHIPTRVSAASSRYLCLECQFDSSCFEVAAISAPLKRGARIQSTNSLRRNLVMWMWMCLWCGGITRLASTPRQDSQRETREKPSTGTYLLSKFQTKKRRRRQRQLQRSPKMIDENHTSQHTSTATWQATSPGSTPRAPTRRRYNLEKDFENDLDKNSVTTQTRSNLTNSGQHLHQQY